MYRSFKADYQFGKQKETEVLDRIQEYFKDNIRPTEGGYNRYDFQGDTKLYELKSRTNTYQAYPTTMIPKNKLKENVILLFNFTDGLYYIEYNQEQFSKYTVSLFRRNNRVDHCDKQNEYVYIPVSDLTKIE